MEEKNLKTIGKIGKIVCRGSGRWDGVTIWDALDRGAYQYIVNERQLDFLVAQLTDWDEGAVRVILNLDPRHQTRRLTVVAGDHAPALVDLTHVSGDGLAPLIELLAARRRIAVDGRSVIEGVTAISVGTCLTTMARLIENRADGDGNTPDRQYSLEALAARFIPRATPTNPLFQLGGLYDALFYNLCRSDLIRCYILERDLLPVTSAMQAAGIPVCRPELELLRRKKQQTCNELRAAVAEALDISVAEVDNSDAIREALAKAGCVVTSSRTAEIAGLQHPAVARLIEFRRSKSLCDHIDLCLECIGADGRIRPTWDPLGTGTGRYSCSNPPFQGFTSDPEFLRCFMAGVGRVFVRCDYKQADLRPLAFISQDEQMIDVFRVGQDFHTLTVANLLGASPESVSKEERAVSKIITFGIGYGMGNEELSRQARFRYGLSWTAEDAVRYRNAYMNLYPRFRDWQEAMRDQARTAIECRSIYLRRRRLLPPEPDHEAYRYRCLLNMPAQGTVADAIKQAMVRLHAKLPSTAFIIANRHDELLLEVDEATGSEMAKLVADEMQVALEEMIPGVPVAVDTSVRKTLS